MALGVGLLVPMQCLLDVWGTADAVPTAVHAAELILAAVVTRLSASLEHRHGPCVVNCHALAEVVHATDALSSLVVALRGVFRTNE